VYSTPATPASEWASAVQISEVLKPNELRSARHRWTRRFRRYAASKASTKLASSSSSPGFAGGSGEAAGRTASDRSGVDGSAREALEQSYSGVSGLSALEQPATAGRAAAVPRRRARLAGYEAGLESLVGEGGGRPEKESSTAHTFGSPVDR
jgi:hypothetical protein